MDNLKVFIVDNDPFYTSLLKRKLHNLGFESIHTFHSGESTLENLVIKPDIVVLDLHLDDIPKLDILQSIKESDPCVYVVMLLTPDDIEYKANALKLGAFDCIEKGPKELEALSEVILRIIESMRKLHKK